MLFWKTMYTKQEFIDSVIHEFAVLKHLAAKIPEGSADYRPSEKQRSVLELLQYLSYISSTGAKLILTDDMSVFGPAVERGAKTTVENFAQAMDQEQAEFLAIMDQFTDEEFKKPINLFKGGEKTKAAWLVDSILKWLAAYKMQLFLYIKANGNFEIGTSNVWGGFDMSQDK